MTEKILGEVRSYDDLIAIVRDRASALKLTREGLGEIAGLTPGHASKLLSPYPMKHLGHVTLGPVLGALGMKLVAVEDPEAMARFGKRIAENQAQGSQRVRVTIPSEIEAEFRRRVRIERAKRARKGGRACAARMSAEERRRNARRAGKARWQALTPEQRRLAIQRLNEARIAKRKRSGKPMSSGTASQPARG